MSAPASGGAAIRFPVRGMTCGSCVNRITRAVGRLDGVQRVSVDLGAETVTIRRDSALASNAALADAIANAGYDADLDAAELVPSRSKRSLIDRLLGR